jgi:hypothetical protein
MKTHVHLAIQLPPDSLIARFIHYLVVAWGVILFISNFIAAMLITVGVIFWLSGWTPSRGRQMVLGGIVLLIAMQWMAMSTP